MTRPTITKPKRSHRSKAEQKVKTDVRIFNGTFAERVRHPQVHGQSLGSMVMRVDAQFGQWIRDEAKKGSSITQITRDIYAALHEGDA